MPQTLTEIWTPEKVIVKVPDQGIKHSRLFLRTGDYADNNAFTDILGSLIPQTPKFNFEDGHSFLKLLKEIAWKTEDIVLAIIEATVVIKSLNCIGALRDGLIIANKINKLQERLIPVIVVDTKLAHTRFERSATLNPDGPKQVINQGKALGAIVVPVTADTLRAQISQITRDILAGNLPSQITPGMTI